MQHHSENNLDTRFTIGDWLVEPDALRIVRGDIEKKLEPKVREQDSILSQGLVQSAFSHSPR